MKEKWSKGRHGGCVVSDTPNAHGNQTETTEYYGGYLVAESIPRESYVNIIAAAPEMLDALWAILQWDVENFIPTELFKQAKAAIDKAKGVI